MVCSLPFCPIFWNRVVFFFSYVFSHSLHLPKQLLRCSFPPSYTLYFFLTSVSHSAPQNHHSHPHTTRSHPPLRFFSQKLTYACSVYGVPRWWLMRALAGAKSCDECLYNNKHWCGRGRQKHACIFPRLTTHLLFHSNWCKTWSSWASFQLESPQGPVNFWGAGKNTEESGPYYTTRRESAFL